MAYEKTFFATFWARKVKLFRFSSDTPPPLPIRKDPVGVKSRWMARIAGSRGVDTLAEVGPV